MKSTEARITLTSAQSQKIRDELKEQGYSCKDFAEKLNMSSSTLDNYLRGRAMPLDLLIRIESTISTLLKLDKPEKAEKPDAGLEWYIMTQAKQKFADNGLSKVMS